MAKSAFAPAPRRGPAGAARHNLSVSEDPRVSDGDRDPAWAEDPVAGGRPPLTGALVTLGGVALLTVLVLAIEPLRTGVGDALQGDTASLRSELRDLGFGGVLIALGLALAHAVVWYPAEILDAAAGFVWGFWVASPLVMLGWLINAVVSYWIGRHAARPLLFRFVGRDRFLAYERMVARGGATLLLGMRLVPIVPFSLFSYAAGSARVPLATFMWTTAVGYLPITLLFVYLGSRLEELSLNDPIVWIGAATMLGLLLLTRRLARMLRRGPEPPGDPERAASR
jgi:uncharacterized membrane protein YdjX (TVP38/TMEM64 family)